MANQRDIDRWKKDKDRWNEWAEDRLKAKEKLEKEGKWAVDLIGNATNAETKRWIASATVDFSKHIFTEDVDFSGFVFPHTADFSDVKFEKNAGFGGATFEGGAWFAQCTFNGRAFYNSAKFNADASFNSARSGGPFSLADVKFRRVPDFIQMSFRAPIRLDDLEVIQAKAFLSAGNKENAARYRALKKMAIEAHDHVRELEFFASEARERRGNDGPAWSAAWVFSWSSPGLMDTI
ncbi:hypothetical protein BMS3Bbin10_02727 [bacterium BMS3Bbin10]|nr:hypothetical protein BMS3Bbin10_02727 [bacterium BMS3Bbin10]